MWWWLWRWWWPLFVFRGLFHPEKFLLCDGTRWFFQDTTEEKSFRSFFLFGFCASVSRKTSRNRTRRPWKCLFSISKVFTSFLRKLSCIFAHFPHATPEPCDVKATCNNAPLSRVTFNAGRKILCNFLAKKQQKKMIFIFFFDSRGV